MKKTTILFLTVLLFGCIKDRGIFDKNGNIEALGEPIKIEYYQRMKREQGYRLEENPTFQITEGSAIRSAMNEIKIAPFYNPMKGLWNKVIITYPDTTLQLGTDKKIIGFLGYANFYSLKEENFITKRLKK